MFSSKPKSPPNSIISITSHKSPSSLIISTNSASTFFHFNSTEMKNENSILGGLFCLHASFIASISLTYIALGTSEACHSNNKCFFSLTTIFYCYYTVSHLSLLHCFVTLMEANSVGKGGGLAFAGSIITTAVVSCLLFQCVASMGTFAAVIGLVYGTAVHVLGFYLAYHSIILN